MVMTKTLTLQICVVSCHLLRRELRSVHLYTTLDINT